MKNRLANKMIRTVALLIVIVIFTVSFAVYVNHAATSGSDVEAILHITNGDSAVLSGISFNIWSRGFWGHARPGYTSTVTRNAVSFDETGKSSVISYAQAYENIYPEDYFYNPEYWQSGQDFRLQMTSNFELQCMAHDDYQIDDNNICTVPGLQVEKDKTIVEQLDEYDYYWYGCDFKRYKIDEYYYFAITNFTIGTQIGDDINYGLFPFPYSFTSGIFCTDGETIENILPIDVSSDNLETRVLDMAYISQTNCLVLCVAENLNEVYVYIYHLETGNVDKQYIMAYYSQNEETGEWDVPYPVESSPYLFVNDNFLTVTSGQVFVYVETDTTMESVMRYSFKTEYDFKNEKLYNPYEAKLNCFLSKDKFFYSIYSVSNPDSTSVFDGYRFNINVFEKNKLIFSGYLLIYQKHSPAMLTISGEIPLIAEDGWAVKRYKVS